MDPINKHPLYKKHNIDSAMSSLWTFYKGRFLALFVISLVMSFIIQYASTFADFKELQSITDPVLLLEKIKDYMMPILLISLINLLFTIILQYYVIYSPLDAETNILSAASKSLKYYFPYLIIMILLSFAGAIAIMLGLLVLVIGVFFSILYVMTLFLFILPILMVEGTNIVNAIRRTITLTHKNFWINIGWVAVFLIILIVISVILSGIALLPFTGSFIKTIVNPENTADLLDYTTNPLFIILSAIINALTLPLMPIFATILFFNGKAKEEQAFTNNFENPTDESVKIEDLYAKPYSDDHPDNPENE
jgi:hypothetical protein